MFAELLGFTIFSAIVYGGYYVYKETELFHLNKQPKEKRVIYVQILKGTYIPLEWSSWSSFKSEMTRYDITSSYFIFGDNSGNQQLIHSNSSFRGLVPKCIQRKNNPVQSFYVVLYLKRDDRTKIQHKIWVDGFIENDDPDDNLDFDINKNSDEFVYSRNKIQRESSRNNGRYS